MKGKTSPEYDNVTDRQLRFWIRYWQNKTRERWQDKHTQAERDRELAKTLAEYEARKENGSVHEPEQGVHFVQFMHPGKEAHVLREGVQPWNVGHHGRKFIRTPGAYRTTAGGSSVAADLVFWGEWEADSRARRIRSTVPDGPIWLHEPFYRPLPVEEWAQNTDPFVFGETFHYTGCKQHVQGRPTTLTRLPAGSVILFGSYRDGRFVLDTVFVVGSRAIDHSAEDQKDVLDGQISQAYRDVTIDRWYAGPLWPGQTHRLYFGATPDTPVDGMFSFFPCLPADAVPNGFARPNIELPGVVTQTNKQAIKGTGRAIAQGEAAELWSAVVQQVRDAGLVLGVHAELPPKESA